MKFNTSFKKFACLLLAILMLLGTVGCKDNGSTKKKKKVIVKKQVIVQDDDDSNIQNNSQVVIPTDTDKNGDEKKVLPDRPLPEVAEDTSYVEWQEPVVPEFDYEYADLSITKDYVIVYALEKWENRKESRNEDGTDRYINYTGNARISAYDLQAWFKDNLGLKLDVQKDTEVDASAKKILVGDTAYSPSNNLAENEFAVRVNGDDLVFEGGHFVMVTKAAKWFETVDVKEGKVATLSGKSDDFKSQVTLNGVTYDYVWGDEFDGYEFINSEKWTQSSFGDDQSDSFVSLNNDPDFHYVENGRLHLKADRYYNESYPGKGYASSGDTNTQGVMEFRNGYIEFRARLPYRRGAFPAIWTMSNNKNKKLPNYNYDDGYGQISKVFWIIEFDLFESFGEYDHANTTIHKWYTESIGKTTNNDATVLTDDQVKMAFQRAVDEGYASKVHDSDMAKYGFTEEYLEKVAPKINGEYYFDRGIITRDAKDAAGNPIKEYIYYPVTLEHDDGTVVDLINYQKRPFTNMSAGMMTNAYSYYYVDSSKIIHKDPVAGKYDWKWYFDNYEKLNQEYHVYSYLYTSDHCTVYMDGEVYVDFDWDPTFDMSDVDGDGIIDDPTANAAGVSNNGVGYNVWHYFLIDNMIYPPDHKTITEERKIQKGDCPFHLYVDWVRVYQDLDDPSQALWFPKGEAD